jgi:hypothetical protein
MRYPTLGFLIPPVRLTRALLWLLRYDLRAFGMLVLFSPLYLAGATTWSVAFVRSLRTTKAGAREPNTTQEQLR